MVRRLFNRINILNGRDDSGVFFFQLQPRFSFSKIDFYFETLIVVKCLAVCEKHIIELSWIGFDLEDTESCNAIASRARVSLFQSHSK